MVACRIGDVVTVTCDGATGELLNWRQTQAANGWSWRTAELRPHPNTGPAAPDNRRARRRAAALRRQRR